MNELKASLINAATALNALAADLDATAVNTGSGACCAQNDAASTPFPTIGEAPGSDPDYDDWLIVSPITRSVVPASESVLFKNLEKSKSKRRLLYFLWTLGMAAHDADHEGPGLAIGLLEANLPVFDGFGG